MQDAYRRGEGGRRVYYCVTPDLSHDPYRREKEGARQQLGWKKGRKRVLVKHHQITWFMHGDEPTMDDMTGVIRGMPNWKAGRTRLPPS